MRRLTLIVAALLALALAGSYAGWRWAVGQMQTQLAAWTAQQTAQGWTVGHDAPQAGGWPMAAELTLPNLTLTGPGRVVPGGVEWSGARVTLRVGILQPRLITASVKGVQHVRVGRNAPVEYTADRFVLSAPLTKPPREVGLDAGGVRFADGASIGLLQATLQLAADTGARQLRVTAEAMAFPPPPDAQPPLGGHIASATIEATLAGTLPADATDPAAAATAWQASGGAVAIRRMALGWGPLGVSGSGSLSLDAALQPRLDAKLHLVGYAAALQALAAGHAITPNAALAAGAVLTLLATQPAGGGEPTVDVPIGLHDRTLSMGHIPLAKLPELVWPNASASGKVSP